MDELKSLIKRCLHEADGLALRAGRGESPSGRLVNVLFHSLYASQAELGQGHLAANQNVTVADFRSFVAEMLEHGHTVVSPRQIDAGLDPDGRYLSLTFDDGYFNNALAVEVLQEFRVPAVFFISTDHVQHNKAFWWDALSRELAGSGLNDQEKNRQIRALKSWTPRKIDHFLRERFGPRIFQPLGDIDRPFTPAELKDFASSPWVHLGNHTGDHAILPNCSPEDIREQITMGQDALQRMVGYRPIAIAYPNGNYSPDVVRAAQEAGLRVGYTVAPHANSLPLTGAHRMALGRFLFFGGQDIARQCRQFSARFVPSLALKNALHSVRPGY
jgi:peptidoglycan/xylan/chitin deacetylase (PgdA/CDA1 family)